MMNILDYFKSSSGLLIEQGYDGVVLHLPPGDYPVTETLVIPKQVSVVGSGKTTLHGFKGSVILWREQTQSVSFIDGIRFSGSGSSAITGCLTRLEINSNEFDGELAYGVKCQGEGAVDVDISCNGFGWLGDPYVTGTAIHIGYSDSQLASKLPPNDLSNNLVKIRYNRIFHGRGQTIHLAGGFDFELDHNDFEYCGDNHLSNPLIDLVGTNQLHSHHNWFEGNSNRAIYGCYNDKWGQYGNTIISDHNRYEFIKAESSKSRVIVEPTGACTFHSNYDRGHLQGGKKYSGPPWTNWHETGSMIIGHTTATK